MNTLGKVVNDKNIISTANSNAITYLRCLSTIFIVLCHYLQAQNNQWAWFFNIGVQLFFMISAFLYSKRDIDISITWLKGRLKKLLPPFYLYMGGGNFSHNILYWFFFMEERIDICLFNTGVIRWLRRSWTFMVLDLYFRMLPHNTNFTTHMWQKLLCQSDHYTYKLLVIFN